MDLKKGLMISFFSHAIVLMLFIVQTVIRPQSPILDLSQAVRVDMVELPNKLDTKLPEKVEDVLKEPSSESSQPPEKIPEAENQKTPPKEAPPAVNKEPEINLKKPTDAETKELAKAKLKKAQEKQKAAFNKLKKLSALEKIKQEVHVENRKAEIIKGQRLSSGTVPKGLDKLNSDNYLATLDMIIKKNWLLPQWLIGKPLKARVLVKFDVQGKIISKQITQSSGESTYDEYCLLAVDKSEPFPAVPDKFSDIYRIDGVTFAFPD